MTPRYSLAATRVLRRVRALYAPTAFDTALDAVLDDAALDRLLRAYECNGRNGGRAVLTQLLRAAHEKFRSETHARPE